MLTKSLSRLLMATILTVTTSVAVHAASLADVLQSASHHGAQYSFVKNEYRGRVSREAFAENPRAYLRHENAYQALKLGFEVATGRSYTDRQFARLLSGRTVRTSQCNDRIMTTGIDRAGNISWFVRDCHEGESLVQVRVSNAWVTVASDWCWNLVNGSLVTKAPAPVALDSETLRPDTPVAEPPAVNPPATKPPVTEPPVEKPPVAEPPTDDPKSKGPKGNNGWGNGDQSAPGNSGPNNNAENNGNEQGDKPDPSHGGNAGNAGGNGGGQGKDKGNAGGNGGGKGKGRD